METEYIRGKNEERNGMLSARAPARFTPRGNDVWAHRSGRVYQAPVEGGRLDFSSPVTGNGVMEKGMGKLSNLVGARKPRSRSSSCEEGNMKGGFNWPWEQTSAPAYAPKANPGQPGTGPKAPAPPGAAAKMGSGIVGGAEHMMSPEDAKRLTMMDYRGGRHPYLTRGGAVRKHLKGTGIWDSIKNLASKTANEFTNPESLLRGTYAKNVADLAELIPDKRAQALAKTARNLQKGEWSDLADTALSAYDAAQKPGKKRTTGQQLAEVAQGLKGKPKPKFMSDMPHVPELEDKKRTYNWTKDYNKPILPGRSRNMPSGPLMLEDAPQMLMLEDMPRSRKSSGRADALRAKFAAQDAAKAARRAAEGRGGARTKRGAMVAKVMRERGVSLPEASRIVKAEGLA